MTKTNTMNSTTSFMRSFWAIMVIALFSLPTLTAHAAVLSFTTAVVKPTCNGSCDGIINTNAKGGTPPYYYAWSNGQTTPSATGLCAGAYTVTVTDDKGAQVTKTVNVSQPSQVRATLTVSPVNCTGACDGYITSVAAGGTPPYTFLWSNGATTADIYNLCQGAYSLTITDSKGCVGYCNKSVSQPTLLRANATSVNATCFGACNGSAAVAPSGGVPPYDYSWSNGATTSSINGLCAGLYTITVTDFRKCTRTSTVEIKEPAVLSLTPSSTNVTCFGACNGTADVLAAGGTGIVTYAWSNGATTANLNNLCAGTYTVNATDENNCQASVSVTVIEPKALSAAISNTDVSCFGSSNGSAEVIASEGTAPYTYLWSNGETTSAISNLDAGYYEVTVTDFNGCSVVKNVTVIAPKALVALISNTNASCFGSLNGSAEVIASEGTAPYTYLWSNGETTSAISNLAAGYYEVTVTDFNGCSVVKNVTVIAPKALVALISNTNVSCFGSSNGSAEVIASEGTAPYTYLWSNGETTSAISNLAAGYYEVTVTDFNGCSVVKNATVIAPKALVALISKTDVSCFSSSNGSAEVIASEGTAPYSYLWSNGATTSSINNLGGGTYTVTVTDFNGCTVSKSVTITQPAVLVASSSKSNVVCKGSCTGSANASANGGTAPYSYLWSNNATSASINALCAGWYTVTVTDANGCTATSSVEVKQPATNVSASVSVNSNCTNQGSNGSLTATATGGTPPYTYLWSNGRTTATNNNLAAGTYTVTVTDANGCTAVAQGTITAPLNCGGFRTQTQGGWGQCQQNGNNPGSYLAQNFASSFPNGVTVGCGNKTLRLTTYTAVCNFLPSTTTPRALNTSLINPGQNYHNVFAGQVVTLAINLGFDQTIANFSTSQTLLGDQVIQSGPFNGWTVNQLFAAANAALGGCSSSYSFSTLNNAVDNVNNNYDNGYNNNGFLACPGQGGCGGNGGGCGGNGGGCGGNGGNGGGGGCGHRVANAGSDLENFGMVAYPNPFTTSFYVQLHAESAVEIYVMDLSGKVVAHYNNVTNGIEIGSDLPSGAYFLKATDESGASRTIKMVKGN